MEDIKCKCKCMIFGPEGEQHMAPLIFPCVFKICRVSSRSATLNLSQGVGLKFSYRVLLSQHTHRECSSACLGFFLPPSPSRSDSQDRRNNALSFSVGVLQVIDTYTAGICLLSLINISLRVMIQFSLSVF